MYRAMIINQVCSLTFYKITNRNFKSKFHDSVSTFALHRDQNSFPWILLQSKWFLS